MDTKNEVFDFELLKNINLYDILGFNSINDFNPDQAKKSYRKLALKYHPDKNPDKNSDKFEIIQLAYLILMDESLREQYNNIYDTNLQIKDFNDLKNIKLSGQLGYIISQLSEDEFKKKIHNLNIANNGIFNELDEENAKINQQILIDEREIYINEVKNIYKKDHELISELTNPEDIQKKFNEIFDAGTEQTEIKDITVFNNINTLCNYSVISESLYNSMYSESSVYEESFQINKVPSYKQDTKTIEEKMKEYNLVKSELDIIAKQSNSFNINYADNK